MPAVIFIDNRSICQGIIENFESIFPEDRIITLRDIQLYCQANFGQVLTPTRCENIFFEVIHKKLPHKITTHLSMVEVVIALGRVNFAKRIAAMSMPFETHIFFQDDQDQVVFRLMI